MFTQFQLDRLKYFGFKPAATNDNFRVFIKEYGKVGKIHVKECPLGIFILLDRCRSNQEAMNDYKSLKLMGFNDEHIMNIDLQEALDCFRNYTDYDEEGRPGCKAGEIYSDELILLQKLVDKNVIKKSFEYQLGFSKCNVCGYGEKPYDYLMTKHNYCPNCGQRLR